MLKRGAALGVALIGLGAHWVSAMSIVVTPDAGLSANSAAMAAFNRAAQAWASKFSNNITINIAGGLSNSFAIPGVIGSTSSVRLPAPYDFFLGKIKASAASEVDDGIVASLPSAAQLSVTMPSGFTFSGNFSATKANFKALGYMDLINLDAVYGATDATITFNSNVAFDYDNRDGVAAGKTDFETVAMHEIGHALGFVSAVDTIDVMRHNSQTGSVSITPLDLFRFQDNVSGKDPATAAQFTSYARYLSTGGSAILDDLSTERALSTGRYFGDGLEASHWKDDAITGKLIGLMDPSLNTGIIETISAADVRALDLIGYTVVPEPGTFAIALVAAPLMLRRVRSMKQRDAHSIAR
jgi:hypothetical protein